VREIKFRAWDKKGREMFRVIMLSFPVGRNEIIVSGRGGSITLDKRREGRYLMQYTGLHDKNGKEIYEGDIIKTFGLLDNITGPVEFSDYKLTWQIHPSRWNEDVGFELFDIRVHLEVIGNIYENPDLLENK